VGTDEKTVAVDAANQRPLARNSLERLNYFSTHSKDFFLYLVQVLMAALLCLAIAFATYALRLLSQSATAGYVAPLLLTVVVVFVISGVLCALGLAEAGRMSDKRIDAIRNNIQKNIDEINRKLNTPV